MALTLPQVVRAEPGMTLTDWSAANASTLSQELSRCGAVLLRGFGVSSDDDFRSFVQHSAPEPLEYVYRSTPRTDLGGGVFTATEYPPGQTIPMHNENSYQRVWPLRLMFACLHPAADGMGQTPLADTLAVTQRIDPAVRREFADRGVMYTRNYGTDIDLPWQTVFQTTSRDEVEQYCRAHDIGVEWKGGDRLTTRQVCQGLARHPTTGALVWFNQAHLFHPSALNPRTRAAMAEMMSESEFPRNAAYGDGEPIEEATLAHVRRAFEEEAALFRWEAGDLLVLDNMLVSHGRTPFRGPRRVVVAMSHSYEPASWSQAADAGVEGVRA